MLDPVRRRFALCLAWAVVLWICAPAALWAQPQAPWLVMNVGYCGALADLTPAQAERACSHDTPQVHDGAVLARLRIHNPTSEPLPALLLVSPYYHRRVEVYEPRGSAWALAQVGGADLGGRAPSASLGGHRFGLLLPPGDTAWLLRVRIHTPKLAHLRLDLENPGQGGSTEQLLLALHIGMLLMILTLALLGWVANRSPLQFRLLGMIALVPMSVGIGSGALFLLWPDASPHWWGAVVFNAVNVLRLGCLAWIFEAMVGGHQPGPTYRRLNLGLYAGAWLAVAMFAIDRPDLGWLLTGFTMLAALAVPAYGLHAAQGMLPRLRRLLQAYLAGLLLLLVGAIASMLLSGGRGNVPVYITRVIDLTLPLGVLVTAWLRNRIVEDEFRRTQAALDEQTAALASERQSRHEKRMLLDMLTHEIKNPLASISFAVTTLSQSQEGKQGQTPRRLENISRSVDTIDQIIERCNLASGIEDERFTPRLADIDLTRLLRELIDTSPEAFRLLLPTHEVFHCRSDAYLLKVVAANLVDNALKYAKAESVILVEPFSTVFEGREHFGFRVVNEVDPDIVPDPNRLFQRYYRHPMAQRLRGSGLGLSICRQICQLLGGRIDHRVQGSEIMFEVHLESA